jgi:hypothetical protein
MKRQVPLAVPALKHTKRNLSQTGISPEAWARRRFENIIMALAAFEKREQAWGFRIQFRLGSQRVKNWRHRCMMAVAKRYFAPIGTSGIS